MSKIKALVVDDSPLMRKLIKSILEEEKSIEVIDTAPNGKIALEKIALHKPDIITLDVEMPVMNGIETLKRIMTENPMPVIMISAFTERGADLTFQALDLGAIDFITKPDSILSKQILDIKQEIIMKVKEASELHLKKKDKEEIREIEKESEKVIKRKHIHREIKLQKCKNIVSIGISTGGPEALKKILPTIPPEINAGILIVQHMPIGFTQAFADRMNSISLIDVKEADTGDVILPGKVLIARGDFHLKVKEEKYAYIANISRENRVSLFRPSIDVLMISTSDNFGENNIGILMTGMGHDGVDGMKRVKESGGKTIAQDKATSVVFGMNKLAIKTGCIDQVLPLNKIVPTILNILG